jgi:hypothetical protein
MRVIGANLTEIVAIADTHRPPPTIHATTDYCGFRKEMGPR